MRENAYTAQHTHMSKLHVCTTKQTSALCSQRDHTEARACTTDRRQVVHTCEHYVIRGDTITRIVVEYMYA